MDTFNKIVESASYILWGPVNPNPENEHQEIEQHGEEPLSGVQGKGTATDPYDAGNKEPQANPVSDTPATSTEDITGIASPLPPTDLSATTVTAESAPMVEQAKPERSDPNPGAVSGAEEKISNSPYEYEEEPEIKVSEEALRGPQNPAPRPEYDFEKQIDGKGGDGNIGQGTAGHHENVARNEDHHSHGAHLPRNISKLKDRFIGRAVKAGNHLHSTNR